MCSTESVLNPVEHALLINTEGSGVETILALIEDLECKTVFCAHIWLRIMRLLLLFLLLLKLTQHFLFPIKLFLLEAIIHMRIFLNRRCCMSTEVTHNALSGVGVVVRGRTGTGSRRLVSKDLLTKSFI